MKQIFLLIMLGLISFGQTSQADSHEITVSVQSYPSTYRSSHPMPTDDRCDKYGYAGLEAYRGAEDQALKDCYNDFNSDCTPSGVRFKVTASKEFPGYLICQATVTVHGYHRH